MDHIFKGMFVRETPQSNCCTGKAVDRGELSPATHSGALPASLPSACYSATLHHNGSGFHMDTAPIYASLHDSLTGTKHMACFAVSPTPTLVSPAGVWSMSVAVPSLINEPPHPHQVSSLIMRTLKASSCC